MIDIIIPTYKPQEYLWQCLNSIANQTIAKKDYCVILVLNGCCEPYNRQIKKWISYHPEMQIKYIQTDVPGVSNARNIGLKEAYGDYICFIDDDDYISDNYFELLLEKVNESTIAISNIFEFEETSPSVEHQNVYVMTYNKLLKGGKSKYYKYRRLFLSPWMKLIPRSYVKNRFFNTNFSNWEDTLFLYSISDKIKYIEASNPKAIYYRRCRDNSAVDKFYRDKIKVMRQICRMTYEIIRIYIPRFWRFNLLYTLELLASVFYSIFKKSRDAY